MPDEIDQYVERFANAVMAQNSAISVGNHRAGNIQAGRYAAMFNKLCEYGDKGKDRLATLFDHSDVGVREMAAVFLLRHRTDEALSILREIADGEGLVAFGASEAIKRWEEGSWNLEP